MLHGYSDLMRSVFSCRKVCWQSPNETAQEHVEGKKFFGGKEEGEIQEETGL